jgi:hypothetical protein
MRRIIIFVFGFILILLYSCSKEVIEPDQTGDLKDLTCGKGGLHKPAGPVFTVSPGGGDDTQALIDAFEAAKQGGPGAVVQLEEGQYTIGMIEVRDFDGYFRGAGKDKTIISNLPELPCSDWLAINVIPFLLQFVNGNVRMSDMSLRINDGHPCAEMPESYTSFFGDMLAIVLTFTDYTATYVPDDRYIKGSVKNVNFIGGALNGGNNPWGLNYNTNMSIYCGSPMWFDEGFMPLSIGEISMSGCSFDKNVVGPDVWGFDKSSKVIIENNDIAGSVYGMYLGCNLGSQLTLKNNRIHDGLMWDIYLDDSDYGYTSYQSIVLDKRTELTIIGNNILSPPGVIGIYMLDSRRTVRPDEGFPQLIDIKFNRFNTLEGGTAIYGLNNVDAKIWNNRFTGTGAVGVMLDGNEATDTWAENNKIMGNNFSGATYTDATVYLGAYTTNCKVVGVATDKAVDLGVNNSVIGVKAQKKGPHYHPEMHGQFKSMQENMMRMRAPEVH